MHLLRRFLVLIALFSPVLWGAEPFPQQGSDLRPDPAARFGTLPNGVRYVILPNHEPKDRASLRLVVGVGSLEETDAQRGLAHFLEHMAFNGSKNYPPDTLDEILQRMGMSFGGDTNASTSFDRTVYMLEMPDTKEATLAEGFKVFSDFAGGLSLSDTEIDKERGIILSEKRTRDSVQYRTFVSQFDFVLGSTLFPKRQPIGEASVITESHRDRFVDFYNTWYRPEKMTVVAVGDFDPAAIEKQIAAAMSAITARGPARPMPDYGRVAEVGGVRANFHREAEAPSTSVSIDIETPYKFEPDTKTKRLKDLPRDIANAMIDRRLSILAKKEGAPFNSGSASSDESFNYVHEASIDMVCKPDQWQAALAVAEQELRRALQFGFQPAELKEVASNLRNDLEQAVKSASTRRSEELASGLASSLVDKAVFTSPADDLALFGPALDKITVDDCLQALRTAWDSPGRYVLVAGNADIPGDATAAITTTYNSAHNVAVTAPEAISELQWAYTDFGKAGEVASRTTVNDLDITEVTFANGVRLNIKKTDFEANSIDLLARVGDGQLTEPKDKPGLATFSGMTFTSGGLGKHSTDDLRQILAGRTVGVGFRVGGDALQFSGGTNKEDLVLELQLMAAHIVDPGYRPEALRLAQQRIEQTYTGFEHTTNGPFATEVPRLLANGDPRFGLPAKEVMLGYTLDQTKAWLAPQLARGAIELSIVGDLDVEATIQAVARTIGALPTREPKPALAELRRVSFPEKPFDKAYAVATEIPKGVISLYWPTTDANDVHRTRRMNVLASVFNDRLRVKVREELGDAYSPDAGSSPSDIYTGYGMISAGVVVDPPRAKSVADVIVTIASELAKGGVTEDELQRAKEPILTSLRESSRTNGYWLGTVLARAQEKPEVLDWCRSRYADYGSITRDDVDALAKSYLGADRAFRVAALPAAK